MGMSFVTLLATDYHMAFATIQAYASIAEEILLLRDDSNISFAGNPMDIDYSDLYSWLDARPEIKSKTRIIAADLHSHGTPRQNDTMARNISSQFCKPGNWIMQVNADEVLLTDPEKVANDVATVSEGYQIWARWISVFKVFGKECLAIAPANEWFALGTTKRNAYIDFVITPEPGVKLPIDFLHFSWGRDPGALKQKLKNWGHCKDFDTDKFLAIWHSINLDNYRDFVNFHPLCPAMWPGLVRADLP